MSHFKLFLPVNKLTAAIFKPSVLAMQLAIIIVCLINSLNTLASTADNNESSASKLAAAVLEAYGGVAKLHEVRARGVKSHGHCSVISSISGASNAIECDIISKGEKLRIEMTLLGQAMVTGFDGKRGWTQVGDWVSPTPEKAGRRLEDEVKHGLSVLLALAEPNTKLVCGNKQLVQGKLCETLKVSPAEGKSTTFFIDPTNHLIVRSEFKGTDPEQGVPAIQATEYEDYRLLAGTMFPYKSLEYIGSKKIAETVLSSIDPNINVDDKTFEMPKETEIGRLKAGPVTLPFEYVGNEILVKARINNGNECKFIVDTGASQTVLDKTAAVSLGPHTVSTFTVTTGAKAVPLSFTKLATLTLGDLSIDNTPALISDLSSFAQAIGERPTGLIGANILRRFLVTIDYQNKKIVLADPQKVRVPEKAYVIPTSPVFGATALVVKGRLDNIVDVNFLVDTGAAFNNLPQSLAKLVHVGPVLPVGQIYGLDGQRLEIGSVKLKSLKLASLNVAKPIFATAPDNASATGVSGLFTAGALGILGNPIWSQFCMTIDYRNERLILERTPEQAQLANYQEQFEAIDHKYLKNKDIDAAILSYEKILVNAEVESHTVAEALAVARIASCYADKYAQSKAARWLDIARREYERASKLAMSVHNKAIEGQIHAKWALLYLATPRNASDFMSAQTLLTRALANAPMESSIYAALGSVMLKVGKTAVSQKLVDQAIMLDPANWQALWSKYQLCEAQSKPKDKSLVISQLARYYPGFPDVVAAAKSLQNVSSYSPKFGLPRQNSASPYPAKFGLGRQVHTLKKTSARSR